jgi:hypothetical protein
MKFERSHYATMGNNAGESKDCVIRAVSTAGCLDYDAVHAVFARHGRRDKRATPFRVSVNALKELFPSAEVMPLAGGHGVTLTEFLRRFNDGGHYVAFTSNHAFAVTDCTVHDWSLRTRCRVKWYWKLV